MTPVSGRRAAALASALALLACSPTLDWREVRVDGAYLTAQFPCRPERRARTVTLADANVRMEMAACAAAGTTFAVSYVDVAGPAGVAAALGALEGAIVGNLGASAPASSPFALRGTTPNPLAGRVRADGRRPDGTALQAHAAFFVRGLRVYQASVVGTEPGRDAVDTFFGGLKFVA